ncbi:DNA topoisomerase I [Geoglobus acetivorans]|uniref:DNA topoisomerase 1 n=1 Tax=Geoglobus acetivorans TaxID=565033 RepID=A0ABZ3H6I4_GEOAI|nr:DNA topoisomerase I [Geoglobus acetivorans]
MWLIVTEKDNTARRIAGILFGRVKVRKIDGVNVYFSQDEKNAVVGLKGHIVELDYPKEYNNWSKVPLKSLLKADLVKKVKARNIAKALSQLAQKAERVTIATDYDREGELIGVEALEIIKKANPSVKADRAKYSAITPQEIKKAFSSTTKINFNLAKAAETRQIVDLMWGALLTRLLSLSSGRLGKDFLSVGRVQSPTLRFIVEREREIQQFKPTPYWEIFAEFENGEKFSAKHVKRFLKKEEAEEAFSRIGDRAVVKKYVEKDVSERRPIPFNTTEFLREAGKFMAPDKAMSIAENLYMNGYISYPRTDNTVYPPSLNLKAIVSKFLNSEFKAEAEIALSHMKPSRGKKETKDHPPIHPVEVASRKDLSKDEWRIYELVVRRFLATLAPDAVWAVRQAEIDASGEIFKATGKQLVNPGWRAIYVYYKAEESFLPGLHEGQTLKVLSKKIEEKKTKPPGRYTMSSIIKLMEKYNLGTKSTRHEILRKLYSRGYIRGNPLKPTEVAFAVIDALKKEAEVITLPDMTAKLEEDMDRIEEGKQDQKAVVNESAKFLEEVLENVNEEELGKTIREGVRKDRVVGKCPECGNDLEIRKARGRFIGCTSYPECRFTLPLPQKGRLEVTARKCDKHDMSILRIRPSKGKSWTFCPYCSYIEWKGRDGQSQG